MRYFKVFVFILASISLTVIDAAHLGTIGPTYPISEQNALELILSRLKEKERTGELEELQKQYSKRTLSTIKNIPPVKGVVTATTRSQRLIDPSVTYTNNITTDDGQIVIPAGTTINPLEIIGLSKILVFFDGRDPKQANGVQKLISQEGGEKIKPILVAGSWLELTKAWKQQVFFDQHGTLTRRFGIKAVPTVIRQHNTLLVLDEIPPEELLQ